MPTALEMAYYYAGQLDGEEDDLSAALLELNRALQSRWPDDLPQAIRQLLPVLKSYRGLAGSMVRNLEEAAAAEAKEKTANPPALAAVSAGNNNEK